MTLQCSATLAYKILGISGSLPATIDQRRQSVDVSQKGFSEGNNVLCVTLSEIIVFVNSSIPVNANFLSPISHSSSYFSVSSECLETFFKLPGFIHAFRRKIQCFTAQEDRRLVLTSVKVIESFFICTANFLGYVVRHFALYDFWVLQIIAPDNGSIVVEIENHISLPIRAPKSVLCDGTYNDDLVAVRAGEGDPIVDSCENDRARPHSGLAGLAVWAIECSDVFGHAFFLGMAASSSLIIICMTSNMQDPAVKNV